jgi:hypothetical protein
MTFAFFKRTAVMPTSEPQNPGHRPNTCDAAPGFLIACQVLSCKMSIIRGPSVASRMVAHIEGLALSPTPATQSPRRRPSARRTHGGIWVPVAHDDLSSPQGTKMGSLPAAFWKQVPQPHLHGLGRGGKHASRVSGETGCPPPSGGSRLLQAGPAGARPRVSCERR